MSHQAAHKDAVRLISENEERIKIMLEATPLALTMCDRNFNIIDCSQSAVNTLGFSDKHNLMSGLISCAPEYQPDGKPSIDVLVDKIFKAFETGCARWEWMHLTTGGEPIIFDITAIRVKYKDDYALMLHTRDIQEDKTRQCCLSLPGAMKN